MDEDFINKLKDYFTAAELVELLDDVTVEDICYSLEDVILDNKDVLEDYMEHGR